MTRSGSSGTLGPRYSETEPAARSRHWLFAVSTAVPPCSAHWRLRTHRPVLRLPTRLTSFPALELLPLVAAGGLLVEREDVAAGQDAAVRTVLTAGARYAPRAVREAGLSGGLQRDRRLDPGGRSCRGGERLVELAGRAAVVLRHRVPP